MDFNIDCKCQSKLFDNTKSFIMKTYRLFLAACLFLLIGCEDNRNNFMVDDSVGYIRSYGVVDISVFEESFVARIAKSGKGRTSAAIKIAPSDTALDNYNKKQKAKNPSYVGSSILSPSLYNISKTDFEFSASDVREVVEVKWKVSEVVPALKSGSKAIPLKLFSEGAKTDKKRDLLIIRPIMPVIAMDHEMAQSMMPSLNINKKEKASSTISIDIPVKSKDIEIHLSIDNSRIDAYNNAKGTSYTQAPEGLISLEANTVTLKAGETRVAFSYVLDVSKFYNEGLLVDFVSYLVPICIKSTSLNGVAVGADVMYIPIVPLKERELKGPWTVLEGGSQCYGQEPGRPDWAAQYVVERMVDGDLATEWISIWEHDNVFPMSFVFDLGDLRLFKKFKIKDHGTFQGNYQDYEMYMAKEYAEADTQWTLVAKGIRGYGWIEGGNTYDFPVQKQVAGRYLKFVILKAEFAWEDPYSYGRGKLSEVFGEGI